MERGGLVCIRSQINICIHVEKLNSAFLNELFSVTGRGTVILTLFEVDLDIGEEL